MCLLISFFWIYIWWKREKIANVEHKSGPFFCFQFCMCLLVYWWVWCTIHKRNLTNFFRLWTIYTHLEMFSNLHNKRVFNYGASSWNFTDLVLTKLTAYFITTFCSKNDNENLQTKNGNLDNSGIQITPALRFEWKWAHYQCCPFTCENIVVLS